jgi:hypothetical protein
LAALSILIWILFGFVFPALDLFLNSEPTLES